MTIHHSPFGDENILLYLLKVLQFHERLASCLSRYSITKLFEAIKHNNMGGLVGKERTIDLQRLLEKNEGLGHYLEYLYTSFEFTQF